MNGRSTTLASQGTGEKSIPPPTGNSMKMDESSTDVPGLGEKWIVSTLLPTNQLDTTYQVEIQLNTAIVMVD